MNILVLDENEELRNKYRLLLEKDGHTVFLDFGDGKIDEFLAENQISQTIISKDYPNLDIEDFLYEAKNYDEEMKFILTTSTPVLDDFQYLLDLGCRNTI